jgi:hypothetical protein
MNSFAVRNAEHNNRLQSPPTTLSLSDQTHVQPLTPLKKNFNLQVEPKKEISFKSVIKWIYFLLTIFFLLRLLLGFLRFLLLLASSKKIKIEGKNVHVSEKIKTSTSVFGYIFVNPAIINDSKFTQILLHEKIHVTQCHSADILIIELIAAAMWFNPAIWLMRHSLQQIHEYLADEGVLLSGVNKLEYQQLIINQIAEENLVFSSGFNSSIKKRFFMMTKTDVKSKAKSKIWTLLPIAAILTLGISATNAPAQEKKITPAKQETPRKAETPQAAPEKKAANTTEQATKPQTQVKEPSAAVKQKQEPPVAAVSLSKMNVLYLGVDNPVTIAVANYQSSKIRPEITNGKITSKDGGYYNYVIQPKNVGMAILKIYAGDKLISNAEFRVKRVPDPVAKIGGYKSGLIQKDILLNQEILSVDMENFDFDLRFIVTSFKLSTHVKGIMTGVSSSSNTITQEQKTLIEKAVSGQKIYFEEIKVVGPDGAIRNLAPLIIELK